jgi:Domain of unknown function (DUF4389)
MTEDQTQSPNEPSRGDSRPIHEPYPFARLLYAIGFLVIAWLAFWVMVLLGLLQFLTVAVSGSRNEELRRFSHLMARYIQQILEFATMAGDERPFPLGPFPKD